jgi:hypothetical protein
VRQDPERFGPPDTHRIGIALLEQDLGDPVHHRDQVDDLDGGGAFAISVFRPCSLD